MKVPYARRPRLNLHSFVTEMCVCGKHPRTVMTYDVVVSWARGRRYLLGIEPRPKSRTPVPDWAR